MRLSVIIPVYNERHSLGATLKVVARTFAQHQKGIIVVDDCSKDGIREWLQDNFSNGPRKRSSVDFDNDKRGINLTLKSGLNEAMTKLTWCGSKIPFW
jgi:glycosyltransferase involved in cell wall biosynthesis